MIRANIYWKDIKTVIFDVDGTLYSQSKLRVRMIFALLKYYLAHPARYKELFILYHFRKERERKAGYCCNNLNDEQYLWCAEKLSVPTAEVIRIVKRWIYEYPLKYINNCKYEGINELFNFLRDNHIKISIYSDYPAIEKLNAMQLNADSIVTSIDQYINCFKPQPKAIYYICSLMDVSINECIFIGDRYSRDGKCAENAGIPFLILPHNQKQKNNFFIHLKKAVKHSLITHC